MHIFDTRELFADLRDAQLMLKTIRLSMCNVLVRQTQTDRQKQTEDTVLVRNVLDVQPAIVPMILALKLK